MTTSPVFQNPLRAATFGLAALLLAGSAAAQWSLLGRNENLRIYVDQTSIRRSGDLAQMWLLYDHTSAQWVGTQSVIMSVRNLVEYDCRSMRSRTIGGVGYSEQMGGGRVVSSEEHADAQWTTITPGGAGEQTWRIACGN